MMVDQVSIQCLMSDGSCSIPAANGSLPDCFMGEREGVLLKLVGKQLVMYKQLSFLISTQGRIDECRVGSSDLSMMDVRYSNLKTFDGILFPSVVDVNFNGGKQRMHASLDIERLSFNSNPQVAAIDLKRYTKVTVTNILQ